MSQKAALHNSLIRLKRLDILRVYTVMILLFIVSGIMEPNYFSVDHVMQLLVLSSFLGIVAIGQTLTILTGGIDLSVAYALNLGAVMITQMSEAHGQIIGVISVIATGLVIGVLNGLGISYLKISPMVMTLAMNSILKSVTYVYTDGTPKGAAPEWLLFIGSGSILGIKTEILFWLLLSAIMLIILGKTVFGRKIYALGNSVNASYFSGVNNKLVIIGVYALSGLFAVIAGMVMTGFSGLPYLGMGDSMQLSSVAAVVIGGTLIIGGRGGYAGTIAGSIITYILTSILTILDMKDAGRQIIYGLVILAVLFMYGREKNIRV